MNTQQLIAQGEINAQEAVAEGVKNTQESVTTAWGKADVLDSRDQVLTAIKKTLTANGIDLPFPTQQILFHDQTEETDGDRSRQREGWPAGKSEVPKPRSIGGSLGKLADMKLQRNGNGRQGTSTATQER